MRFNFTLGRCIVAQKLFFTQAKLQIDDKWKQIKQMQKLESLKLYRNVDTKSNTFLCA